MRKVIQLKTASGETVKVILDSWGGGMDRHHRRWTLQPEGWHCVDSGEIAQSLETFLSRPIKLWDNPRRR